MVARSLCCQCNLHMTLNVLGWVGLEVVCIVITPLPTIMHVRAAQFRAVPVTDAGRGEFLAPIAASPETIFCGRQDNIATEELTAVATLGESVGVAAASPPRPRGDDSSFWLASRWTRSGLDRAPD
jgi:hypothetical protein